MTKNVDASHRFRPGAELFTSDRSFQLCDYTVSHSQLLLRSEVGTGAERGGAYPTRIDILFKPVSVTRIRAVYPDLRIRCATEAERERIRRETRGNTGDASSFFVLESGHGGFDYVGASTIAWHEDQPGDRQASYWAERFREVGAAWVDRPLVGAHGRLRYTAKLERFLESLKTGVNDPPQDRNRHRDAYILMTTRTLPNRLRPRIRILTRGRTSTEPATPPDG